MLKNIELTSDENAFVTAYFEAIDFTETGDTDQPESGTDLDDDFIRESTIDCLCFYSRIKCYLNSEDGTLQQAGIDFWFTRNGHGTGFWDREATYGTARNHLTETAEGFHCVEPVFDEVMT